MDLEFTISNQTCRLDDKRQQVVNLSENYLVLSFTFTEDWEDTGKFVLYPMEDGTVLRQGINNNKTVVPADVLLGDKFYFTVYGVNNNERITTNLVKVNLLKSGYTDDAITPGEDELTPSVVEEIYLALDEKVANTTFDGALEDINTQLNEIETTLPDKADIGHKHQVKDVTDFPSNVSYFTNDTGYLVSEDIENKVDKETGKGLSTNDYTNEDKAIVDNVTDALDGKVDKETGKGLTTNDFSNGYRNFIDQSRTIRLNSTTNTSTTSKYVVTIPGADFNVAHGTMVGVLNVTGDNTAGATLNVNGSGDKPMYKDNAVITMGAFPNKSFKLFVYVTWSTINGGNGAWLMIT